MMPDLTPEEARRNVLQALTSCELSVGETGTLEEHTADRRAFDSALDTYAAAVRRDYADRVREVVEGYGKAYPVDVWPETPFSDAQAASVMRLMVPRIAAALDALEG